MGRGEDRHRHHHYHNDRRRRQERSGSQGRDYNRRSTSDNQRHTYSASNHRRHASPNRAQIYPTTHVSPYVVPNMAVPTGPGLCMHSNQPTLVQDFATQSVTSIAVTPMSNQDQYANQKSSSQVTYLEQPTSAQQPPHSKISLEMLNLPPEKITETGIIPDLPYYELPAGLMVPLIPDTQTAYKPLKPSDLRLPFPKFPDEKFLQIIDQYYKRDDKTRDDDGWDREFIDTFIKQKKAISETS